MRLSTKDLTGLALVAFTGMVVVVRDGSTRYGAREELAVDQPEAQPGGGLASTDVPSRTTVFFDFNVLTDGRDVALPHQVVLVRGSRIERIGEVGTFTVPDGARRIEGRGSVYLVPGPESVLGRIAPGAGADLLLLERDPRDGVEARRHALGAMIRGRWYGRTEIDGIFAELETP
jgi:imidazolonepropionase-like amidohydrolase